MIVVLTALFFQTSIAAAEEIRYKIDTKEGVNEEKTTAVVDIEKHEIRLPKFMPNMVDFLGDSFEYVVMTPEGVKKVNTDGSMNLVAPINELENPVAGIAGSGNTPDFLVAHGTRITYYSFTESGYVSNPILSSQGYSNVMSVSARELDYAALSGTQTSYRAFDGNAMIEVGPLSPGGFSNPIAMTLFKDHYGMAVLDGDQVKYYKNGSLTHTITGLTNALSISAGDGGNLAVVSDNKVQHYNLLEDGTFAENTVLSSISDLTSPTCVALRPGSFDRIIVDGDEVKYYMWTGDGFVKNTTMSKTITGLQDIGLYIPQAVAESKVYSLAREATHIKLFIDPELQEQEEDTSIAWYITAQSEDDEWIGVPNLGEWIDLGEKTGTELRWKAVLKTEDRQKTPIINPVIVLQTNSKPNPPELELPPISGSDMCYVTSSPEIRWKFDDPDPGDMQSGMQVIIKANGTVVEDSGYIPGEASSYIVDINSTGKLYNTGTNIFTAEVITYDSAGVPSDPAVGQFCVIAFDRPYAEIITPASSSFIPRNANVSQLPSTKAGGLVTIKVFSIGVDTAEFKFPYLARDSNIVGEPAVIETQGANKRWEIKFFTDANTDICPDGTIVNGYFNGNGRPDLMILDQKTPTEKPTEGLWWQWEGYRKWADGVVQIGESVFNNWSVILQGSKRE